MIVNPADLFEALRAGWRLVLAIALPLFALVALAAFLQPRLYQATASLMLDLSQTDPTDADPQAAARVDTDAILATQTELVRSAKVTNAVAREAGFLKETDPALSERQRQQLAADRVRAGLAVETGQQSNILKIRFMDPDPEVAARVANLAAGIYMREQVGLRAATARGLADWFEARTADVRRRYELAQKKLSDFQRANGIIGANRMDLEADKLKNLSMQLVQAQAEAAAANSKSGAGNVSEVAGSLVVQNLEEAAAVQAAKVAELGKTLGPRHPSMVAAQAQLSALQAKLGAARGNQAAALTGNSVAADRREAALRSDMEGQEDRMIAMSDVQDQLMVLARDVEAARQTYDTVRQRFNEAALKSQISQPNASLLDKAAVPLLPASPNVRLWLVAGMALGLLAGIAAVVLLEILRPRARSLAGMARATEVDVIADLSAHSSRPALGWRKEAA